MVECLKGMKIIVKVPKCVVTACTGQRDNATSQQDKTTSMTLLFGDYEPGLYLSQQLMILGKCNLLRSSLTLVRITVITHSSHVYFTDIMVYMFMYITMCLYKYYYYHPLGALYIFFY